MPEGFDKNISAARERYETLRQKRKAKRETRREPKASAKCERTERPKVADMSETVPSAQTLPARGKGKRTDYSPAEKQYIVGRLCIHLSEGGTLKSFCDSDKAAPDISTLCNWISTSSDFRERIEFARETCADSLASDALTIADEAKDAIEPATVNAAKLRVETRKWLASKYKPRVYADHVETQITGRVTIEHTITDDERAQALARIMRRQAIASAESLPDAQRLIEAQAIDVTPEPAPKAAREN